MVYMTISAVEHCAHCNREHTLHTIQSLTRLYSVYFTLKVVRDGEKAGRRNIRVFPAMKLSASLSKSVKEFQNGKPANV